LENGQRDYYFKGYPGVVHLNGEIVLNILEDRSGKLWLVLYRGVVQFDELSESIVNEYLTKEFQNVRVERGAAFRSANGTLLMGGGNGFISFNPDSLFKYSFPPEVCLTDLMISNQSISDIDRKTNRFKLDQAVPYCNSIRLTHKDRVITLVFSAFDFKNPSKNIYSYLLEGFDREWNEVGSRNTATYTNIPHGKYTFKVKAANSEGVWGNECRLIEIVVSPPWWKSTWAYISYFLLVMGLLYFFKEYSIIQVREKGRLLIERMQKEEAQKLDEMKSRFFTDITHEFRTPLTLIMGPAQELSKAKGQSPFNLKQAELIERNAQKLLRLVNQLMEFRKVEKGKMEFYLQKVDMARMLNELFELFKPMSDSQNIEFSLHLQSSEMPVVVDADKYEKILYNLVSNAFKYTESGGKITIRASIENQKDERMLVVEVEDTGIGISAENKGKVFERFFQAHQKRTQSTGGIGLYLTRAFVEQHKGQIELDSEPGKGSCFKVIVPAGDLQFVSTGEQQIMQNEVVDAHPESQRGQINWQDEDEKTINTRLPHILIVEDEKDLNQFIAAGLQQSFKVITCFNGREGLDQARKQTPDIIISDIMMPEMDGYEMCRQLRKDLNTSHIPVIFLTAKTMHEDEIKGLKIGAVDYINKPFSLVSLTLKIQNILGNLKNAHDKMRTDQILEPENIELSSLDEAFLKEAVDTVNRFLDDATFDVERFSHEMGISSNQAYRRSRH
jgi:signal transduction histidine kinase/DNA-binding response OmpR family regulator